MKKIHKGIFIAAIMVLIPLYFFLTPSVKMHINQRRNAGLIEKVRESAISANIKIVQLKYKKDENSSAISVSAGASGVIIRRDGKRYYALTAKHVIDELDNVDKTEIIVMGHQDLDLKDLLGKDGKFQGVAEYYQKFSKGVVEYADDKYDLAIIGFETEKEYAVLPIADEVLGYGVRIASMSNPYGKRNMITGGSINSRAPKTFGDEAGKLQYPVITHTSYISEGSSGSALLNEKLEIVGINLGGNENFFRQFVSGMAMPGKSIHAFLRAWKQ